VYRLRLALLLLVVGAYLEYSQDISETSRVPKKSPAISAHRGCASQDGWPYPGSSN